MEKMKKTIIFLSRKSLFLDFSKECFKAEGHDFFDFEAISEFENQLTDLKPDLFLVDLDNTSLEDAQALKGFNLPVVCFYSEEEILNSISFEKHILKPVKVISMVKDSLSVLGLH
ncbi:MAG: hypothetical protein CME61_07040 [Halobacteriovoraceae bacterium]|nr:hypothetical protein [Halobacteriovoraceae bacterium]|tara:strand:- start:223 stop:567 length:345 start_codon:yes stop_codon:yes gene_type:complete